jgi:3-oxoacyl-[acyl-carrier protein] reductase
MSKKIAIVTGASGGIGLATVRRLAASSDAFVVHAQYLSHPDPINALAEEFAGRVVPARVDLTDGDDLAAFINESSRDGLHVLINNAGAIADNLLAAASIEEFQRLYAINYLAPVIACKAAIRPMLRQRYGRIINVTSIAAHLPGKGQSNYAGTKGALTAFSKSLAVELGAKQITVNCVAPGVIETNMSEEIRALAKDEILSRTALGRFGRAEEVAAAICFLASDDAGFITGQTLHIDGGLKLR